MKDKKVALVHDFLTGFGGAERVLEALTEMFPDAPIYTLLYDKDKIRGKFKDKIIYTSFLQKFPKFLRKRYKYLLPFLPVAPETFDLRDYDLVITSSGAWSKGIITRLNTVHIAYLHSPMRFVWDQNERYLKQQGRGRITGFFSRVFLSYIRLWDKSASDRPDYLISNSKYTQKRVKKYYGRESAVIYPPVDHETRNTKHETKNPNYQLPFTDYFLVVSRLSPYKQIDKVVEAFNKLELPLVVIGEGSEKKYLENIAEKNVKILGWQSDEVINGYYANARAFLFAGVDDFGIASVEAMTRGVPVLSIRQGGIREIVEEGRTGEFFDAATPEVIADCVRRFMENENNYDKEYIRKSVERFGEERFKKEFINYIDNIKQLSS